MTLPTKIEPGGGRASGIDSAALTLHGLRIKGMATVSTLVLITALEEPVVAAALAEAAAADHATFLEGRNAWRITPDGRKHHQNLVGSFLDAPSRRTLGSLYKRFLPINEDLKAACTDWQLQAGEPNEHDNSEYDRGVTGRVERINGRVRALLVEMGQVCRRLERYAKRLDDALAAVRAGDVRKLTGFGCESFHDVWTELHEDLIQLLGIDRAAEGSS